MKADKFSKIITDVPPSTIDIQSITRIDVKKDEILFIQLPEHCSNEDHAQFVDHFSRLFPDIRFMAYIGDLKFKAIKEEQLP